MPRTDPSLTENLVYSSPRILDRRRRILDEARKLIAEQGYHGFRMRDLCRVAEVAPHTVYKAFGNKERLIALALRQYFESHFIEYNSNYPRDSLLGVVEQSVIADRAMRRDREFVKAMVDLYFSFSVDDDLRSAASHNLRITVSQWVYRVAADGELQPGVAAADLIRDMTNLLFAASFEWCHGKLDDARYRDRKIEAMLLCTVASTAGKTGEAARELLDDLRGSRTIYDRLVMLADEYPEEDSGFPPLEPAG